MSEEKIYNKRVGVSSYHAIFRHDRYSCPIIVMIMESKNEFRVHLKS